MEKMNKIVLGNGLKIITIPMKETRLMTLSVFIRAGSHYENQKNNGISHFLEHMLFKGTAKRPTAFDISKSIDEVGGMINAGTSSEITNYWVKIRDKHFDLALDVLADIIIRSKIDAKEIEKEKKVIIEEINMYEDDPMSKVWEVFNQLLYKNQPKGFSILGEKKNITKFQRSDFIQYFNSLYLLSNMVIVVTGSEKILRNQKVENKIALAFKDLLKSNITIDFNKTEKNKKEIKDIQQSPAISIKEKKTDQAHLILGVHGYNLFHPDRYVLSVLNTILGRGMSSRLFKSIREEKGLAYYIYSNVTMHTDVGYFCTATGVNPKKIPQAMKGIIREYEKIKNKKVINEELKRAKEYLKGHILMALENSLYIAGKVGRSEILTNKVDTIKEIFQKIDRVTKNDIQRVANDIFINKNLNLALIGLIDDKNYLKKLLEL